MITLTRKGTHAERDRCYDIRNVSQVWIANRVVHYTVDGVRGVQRLSLKELSRVLSDDSYDATRGGLQ